MTHRGPTEALCVLTSKLMALSHWDWENRLLHSPQVTLTNSAHDCKARKTARKVTHLYLISRIGNTAPVLVSFFSWAGNCSEMMSAHLSQPINSTASAVQTAETATWAETVYNSVCVCFHMCKCGRDGNKALGSLEVGVAACKIPTGNIYIYTLIKSKTWRDATLMHKLRLKLPPP